MIVVLGMMLCAPQATLAQKKKVTIGNSKPATSRQAKPKSNHKPQSKPESKPNKSKPQPKPESKPESTPESKPMPKPSSRNRRNPGDVPRTKSKPALPSNQSFTVNGVKFTMVPVEGGTFMMGATEEQEGDVHDNEKPTHKVTLSTFYIGQTELTQELWEAVMGSNPSNFKGSKLPVEKVSWDDCQVFITRLNQITGKHFRLPTEAEWEYAARGGNKSLGYKYSGSNNIGDVTWYYGNSGSQTHDVATEQPNELGLYDMSGNVWEWCQDWYGDNYYGTSPSNSPTGPASSSFRVSRGGSWRSGAGGCRVAFRYGGRPGCHDDDLGFRLALDHESKQEKDSRTETVSEPKLGIDNRPVPPLPPRSFTSNQSFTANGVTFEMVVVQGGTFTMGGTAEQGRDAYNDEKPAHQVTISSFSIGQTEVTQELWEAVMGSNPSEFKGAKRPVECVSWDDCQEFVKKLNTLTGQNFRLPTEAEWEYAARGGNKSQGYKYSGSNNIDDVVWYANNSGSQTHDVATKQPNELGLYDMSGNVWEWCQDWYGNYSSSSQSNPQGPDSGSHRVFRGGCWLHYAWGCRVSYRSRHYADGRSSGLGLRLAL